MNDLISQYLDIWTSAIASRSTAGRGNKSPSPAGEGWGEANPTNTRNAKYTAYGIKKLRELILELAVRGTLVTQDPNDEPARTLLDKIYLQKTRLIDDGKLKPQKGFPEISEEEISPHLPTGWELVRLGEIMNVLNGRAYKKHEMLQEGTPLLRVGNLFTSNEWYYSDLELEPDKYIDNGDLIYAWSASFGPFIWQGGKAIYHYHIWKLDLYDPSCLDKQFLFYFFTSITEKIKASGNGIAMIHMTKERMEKLILEIPPLAEQHRIVAKVDDLMALCDQLEQQQTDSLAAHQTLVQTLLDTLTQAADAAEFEQAWSRIANHFDTLLTTEHSIDQLKQTLLQLAVMGRLVPQDLNDEPANNLLEKIAIQKNKLFKEKKIRRLKVLDQISQIDKPYILPRGWIWCRLDEFALFENGDRSSRYPNSSDLVECGVPFFGAPDIVNGKLEFTSELRFITMEKFSQLSNGKLVDRDFIILLRGSVGKTAQFYANTNHKTGFINAQMLIIRLLELDMAGYVNYFFKSDVFLTSISKSKSGAVIQQIPASEISKLIVPLPPLAEQHRIVAKVDELMALCDALKARIAAAQTTQLQLADAIVEQAVA